MHFIALIWIAISKMQNKLLWMHFKPRSVLNYFVLKMLIVEEFMLHSIYCLNGSKRLDKKLPAWISDRIPTWICNIHFIWTSWGLHRRIQQGPFAFVQAKTFVLSFFLLLPKHATKNIKILLNWFYYSFYKINIQLSI